MDVVFIVVFIFFFIFPVYFPTWDLLFLLLMKAGKINAKFAI